MVDDLNVKTKKHNTSKTELFKLMKPCKAGKQEFLRQKSKTQECVTHQKLNQRDN